MSTAWATSSNRQSGARIWAAWAGRARGAPWEARRPSGYRRRRHSGRGGSSGRAGRISECGVDPAARDPQSAQGPASRSSEGVGWAGRGGQGGASEAGAVH